MGKISKAASFAAVSASMAFVAFMAGPGFASQDTAVEAKITSDLIKVDEAVINADKAQVETAKNVNVKPVLTEDGNIVFEPGTGDFKQPLPEPDPEITTENAGLPAVVRGASSLKALVRAQDTTDNLSREMECLAGAVYFESKSEPLAGQLAVARVVMERAKSSRFPNTLCGVVYQHRQFSFVRNGRMPRINRGHRQWRNAIAISKIAMNDAWDSKMEGALFFHAKYVNPKWRLKRMGSVGQHIFYR